MATATTTPKLSPAHRQTANAFLEQVGGPFRRQQVAEVLYPRTSLRSRPVADKLAQAIMSEWAKNGLIERHGHLHWTRVVRQRKLRSGRAVPELSELAELSVTTRCPEKWVAVDMETGDVWIGSRTGWRRASMEQATEARACLPSATPKGKG